MKKKRKKKTPKLTIILNKKRTHRNTLRKQTETVKEKSCELIVNMFINHENSQDKKVNNKVLSNHAIAMRFDSYVM